MTLPSTVVDAPGGLQFRAVKDDLATVVDNGIDPDDPRVIQRTNQAQQIILTMMIPVGGYATFNVTADNEFLVLPPELENAIEAYPAQPGTKVRGDSDITQAWYEIVNESMYLDPNQAHDNPLIDFGDKPDVNDNTILHRVYQYPGLQPSNSVVVVTGKKRFLPIESDDDYLIVQNIPALKDMITYIERKENNDPDEAAKYLKLSTDSLEAEVKNKLMDPRNYMRRKSAYQDDIANFPVNTLGWVRGNIGLDIDEAIKTGKIDLTFSINQVERRIMQAGKVYKDMVITITTTVTGGFIYLPVNVLSVLAIDINGCPIPIRSQFFEHLENGPGMFSCHSMLKDEGDVLLAGVQRRRYKLLACCTTGQPVSMVCQLRWIEKQPQDMMTIKNYEAIRLMMSAKFLEEKEDWKNAAANKQEGFNILELELQNYLKGIIFTPRVQTGGFGMGDVGCIT